MKWQVWIVGFPGTYSTVEHDDVDAAIVAKAKEWAFDHRAETITVRATGDVPHALWERDCSINRRGEIHWLGKTLVRTTRGP